MLDAVKLIGELHEFNPWVNLGLNESEFMTKLGITRDCYDSRVRAARALRDFPEMKAAFLCGDVALSTIGMIESKLTRDNIAVVLENVRGKSKGEAIPSAKPNELSFVTRRNISRMKLRKVSLLNRFNK